MSAATLPVLAPWLQRLMVVDRESGSTEHRHVHDLRELLRPDDLLIVNDAGTLPASLWGSVEGEPVEVRLAGPVDEGLVVLFGAGSWRDMTEHRPAPPSVDVGARIDGIGTVVEVLGGRLVRLRFAREGVALWDWLYRAGRPVQYS